MGWYILFQNYSDPKQAWNRMSNPKVKNDYAEGEKWLCPRWQMIMPKVTR